MDHRVSLSHTPGPRARQLSSQIHCTSDRILRGDFALDIGRIASRNERRGRPAVVGDVAHGSDSVEAATRELGIYFSKDDLVSYEIATQKWITE